MTLERLKNLYHSQNEIDILQERINKLKDEAEQITQTLSDMPSGTADDKLGKIVAEYVDLEQELIERKGEQIKEQREVIRYINGIQDSQIRVIFYLRFCDRLTWEQISLRLGGYNSADNCRMITYRYIQKHL